MERVRVFLGLPSHNGWYTGGTLLSVLLATKRNNVDVCVETLSRPSICPGFNFLYTKAVHGNSDFFALLHADVSGTAGWLDVMLDEMRTHHCDVLSAVVAMKNDLKETSTGIGLSMIDTKNNVKLKHDHIRQLPRTFDVHDVRMLLGEHYKGPLLVNTGMMLVRLGGEWEKKLVFDTSNSIDWGDRPTVHYGSEDWTFSRLADSLGLKVMATRAVATQHFGTGFFSL